MPGPSPPSLTAVSPNHGAEAQIVGLVGTNITGDALVTFGTNPFGQGVFGSPGSYFTVTTPNPPGLADVTVTQPSGSSTLVGGYTFDAIPAGHSGLSLTGTG